MKTIIITGGAGFIGTNASEYYLKKNFRVIIFDSYLRKGSKINLRFLESLKKNLISIKGDIRNANDIGKLSKYIDTAELIIHLAGQVAVTTSVIDPRTDFESNALGTLNILEAMRKKKSRAKLIYASTNKVYGGMEDIKITKKNSRYIYDDYPYGINEERNLDFHSPYGCSKGAGDQYVRDYARIYNLDTTVLRQSCIYGPHQFGIEDQGWVAWFIIAAIKNIPLSVYGDGCQVRDILYIDDLIKAYDAVFHNKTITKGNIYNIGGGIKNSISVWSQYGVILEKIIGHKIKVKFSKWRPGDQRIYISDIRKAQKEIAWKPETNYLTGISKLYQWIKDNRDCI